MHPISGVDVSDEVPDHDEQADDVEVSGKWKIYVGVVGFLWTSLVGVGSWALGANSASAQIADHESIAGHPIMDVRVGALETRLFDRLSVMDRRLARIEDRLDTGGTP